MQADVRAWLEAVGFGQYADLFESQQIDADAMPQLNDAHLKELGVPLGPRLGAAGDRASPAARQAPRIAGAPAPDRDVLRPGRLDAAVGRLDPEDLQRADPRLPRGGGRRGRALRRPRGAVARRRLPGLLRLPARARGRRRARRACGAERARGRRGAAGRRASRVCRRASASPPAWSWSARSAPARRRPSRRPAARRPTSRRGCRRRPRRARSCCPPRRARLRRRVVRARVDRRARSSRASPRPSRPGACAASAAWRAASRRSTRAQLIEFVGRASEVALLLERWGLARDGEGQVVLLSGEAGIGKSRISQTLRERWPASRTRRCAACSPYHAAARCTRWCSTSSAPPASTPADAPSSAARSSTRCSAGADRPVAASLIAAAPDGAPDGGARCRQLELTPQQEKAQTLQAPIDLLRALARAVAGAAADRGRALDRPDDRASSVDLAHRAIARRSGCSC